MSGYNSEFCNGYRPEVGALHNGLSGRSGGKKIFTWKFYAKGAEERPVEVAVTLLTRDGLKFSAYTSKLPAALVDTDLDRLFNRVEQALLEQAEALSGIAWEDWFEVMVTGSDSDFDHSKYSALGASLKIQVNRLKHGIHPKTGAAVTINRNGCVTAFPTPKLIDEPGEWKLGGRDIGEYSYIPATPANRAALDGILNQMVILRLRLANVLSQSCVQEKLAQAASNLLFLPEQS